MNNMNRSITKEDMIEIMRGISKKIPTSGGIAFWQPETEYIENQIILHKATLYRVTENFTSGLTFKDTKLEMIDGGSLKEWEANTEYSENNILVYEGQIYTVLVKFTSGTTFEKVDILEEYTLSGGETPITWAKGEEITTNDIVEYNSEYYKALVDFTCGEEFTTVALKEYVPQPLTEEQIGDAIDAYSPDFGGVSLTDELRNLIYCFRKPETAYALGDIAYVNTLPVAKKLVCVSAGISSKNSIIFTSTDEGVLVTDGTVTWMIDSLADGIYTAGHQNAKYREADLTAYWDSGLMSTNIQAGKFIGIYPGDYIVKTVTVNGTTYNNVNWVVGDLDYYYQGYGSTGHHVLMFPRACIGTARMNSSDTTSGGYVNSEMWKTTIPKYKTGIQNAFGTSHIMAHNELMTTGMNSNSRSGGMYDWGGATNGWAWQIGVTVNLFNEIMVYGSRIFSSSGLDTGWGANQVNAFKHNNSLMFAVSNWYWLRSVAYSTNFCIVGNGGGYANHGSASRSSGGVRPYFLLT